jgi:OHCU decarboxylase
MNTLSLHPQLTEMDRVKIRLAALNDCAPATARFQFKRCCGSSKWSALMAKARPFSSLHQLETCADRIWKSCAQQDWLEALASHPRIGAQADTRWCRQEQSGVAEVSAAVRAALDRANRKYEAKFGYIFVVCATGKVALEVLAAVEERLGNDPSVEIRNAAEQQRLITRLRLRKLLSE